MNKERILQLADAIERGAKPELGFNMNYFESRRVADDSIILDQSGRNCGTVACIAGHAAAIAGRGGGFSDTADWLGLDYSIGDSAANELFFPGDISGIEVRDWQKITPAHAVAVLRRLVETGKVDWTAVLPEDMFTRPNGEPNE